MPPDPQGLRATILRHFPPQTHGVTLVRDPDSLLHDAALADALRDAGVRVIQAGDPVVLRQAWYAAQPVTPEQPLVIVTRDAIKRLPYDIWQQGIGVDLALVRFYPNLDVTLLAGLPLDMLERIFQAQQVQPPPAHSARLATLDYILLHVFGVTVAQLAAPGPLLRWLAGLHADGITLPEPLRAALLPQLGQRPPTSAWPLAELLSDGAAWRAFVQGQWQGYVRSLGERATPYAALIPFAGDAATQSAVSMLVDAGVITPMAVDDRIEVPTWAGVAVHRDASMGQRRRWHETVAAIEGALAAGPATWDVWQTIAGAWADLTVQLYAGTGAPDPTWVAHYAALGQRMAPLYAEWVRLDYPMLANRRMPVPHHLHHIPTVLAQRAGSSGRVALLVLDGMSLAVWRMIAPVWLARHPAWRVKETLVLAQIPTITAISRQALVAGKPPRSFAESLTHNRQEAARWRAFWEARDLPASAVGYANIAATVERPQPTALDSRQTRALAVIVPDIDGMVHGATEGLAGLYAGLRVWLGADQAGAGSAWVETLIQTLLEHGYRVALTSDHGHVEAVGIGQPQDGVTVTTRSKRAHIYASERSARAIQSSFGNTTLWYDDGILPDHVWVLMANGADAFALRGERVVSHGGITLDETVVPFVEIEEQHG